MSWQNRVLRVNLTEGSISVEPLNMQWAQEYLGERGLATKYLMEGCLLYTSPSPRDQRGSRMPSSA